MTAYWQRKKLSEICTLKNGTGFTPKDWDTSGLPIIRIQNLNGNKKFNYYSKKPDENWIVHPGTLLFAWAGTKGVSFGPCVWEGEIGVLNQHIYKIIPEKNIDNKWLYLILRIVTDNIEQKAHGFKKTLVHVNKKDIDDQFVLVPPFHEQQKIARILTTWDAAITCTQELLENSKQQKKALMQQLLTGRRRLSGFNGEWRQQSIQSFSQNSSKKNIKSEQLPVLSCSKHYGFIDSLEYFKKKVFSNDLSTYKIICRGEFGYPANHIEEGAIGYQNKYPRALVSPIYIVFKLNEQIDANFVYSILKTDSYRQKFSTATSASVDRRGSLRWPEFSKIKIFLPPLEEQKAIAAVLSAADALIAQYEARLAHLQKQKKALMQQLLTGKIRVTPDTPDATPGTSGVVCETPA